MNLNPINIKTKDFSTSLRGYNREEVREYLDQLSLEVEDLLIINENLQAEVGELRLNLTEAKTLEQELKNSLANTNESITDYSEKNQKNSSEIIREAELKAAQIVNRAKESANEIRNAVLTLREQKELIIAKLKAIVETQAGLIESKIDPLPEVKEKIKKQEPSDDVDVDVDDIVNKIL